MRAHRFGETSPPMPLVAVLLLLAAPAEAEHRFVHFLAGVPVGEIRLLRTGASYTYVSQHFFRRGVSAVERFSPSGSDDPVWASESLLKPHPIGCWAVEDEITRQRGEVCVTQAGAMTKGTLLGQPFAARYTKGSLQELTVGDSRFTRQEGAVAFADPFAEGLMVVGRGDALALLPPITGARRAMPKRKGENEDCLAAAKAWVKEHRDFEVVLGLVDDGKRGWPHAWVRHRETGEEIDPSRPQIVDVTPRYLALPTDQAAAVYLDLLGKRRTLRRVPAP